MILCITVCVCDWPSMESPRRGLTSFSFPVSNRKPEVNGFRNNFARPEPYTPKNVHDTSKASSVIGNKYEETLSFEKIREICIQKWVICTGIYCIETNINNILTQILVFIHRSLMFQLLSFIQTYFVRRPWFPSKW